METDLRVVYRWFPTGKIVFLAPTKPLVNQQIEACQMTCGIPSADAAVMTGSSVSAKERARLVSWLDPMSPSSQVDLTRSLLISGLIVGREKGVLLYTSDLG